MSLSEWPEQNVCSNTSIAGRVRPCSRNFPITTAGTHTEASGNPTVAPFTSQGTC